MRGNPKVRLLGAVYALLLAFVGSRQGVTRMYDVAIHIFMGSLKGWGTLYFKLAMLYFILGQTVLWVGTCCTSKWADTILWVGVCCTSGWGILYFVELHGELRHR